MLSNPGNKTVRLLTATAEPNMAFQVTDTEFVGLIYYRTKSNKASKPYILIFSSSLGVVNLETFEKPDNTYREAS